MQVERMLTDLSTGLAWAGVRRNNGELFKVQIPVDELDPELRASGFNDMVHEHSCSALTELVQEQVN